MIEPYELPHECEREGLAKLLAGLTRRQRQVLRSYVWQVELGERTVSQWLEAEACPISRSQWYNATATGKYWGNETFRAALATYVQAGLEWQTSQERRAVEAAQRRIRRAAPVAAERIVEQVGADIGAFFKVVERWTDSPLPSQEIVDDRSVEVDEGDGVKLVREYRVKSVVLDLEKLKDPKYSRWVREFSDSPKNGLGLKLWDSLRAAESVLDRADVETATKSETRVEGEVGLDDATLDRLDQALMSALFGAKV